jgi:general secretion pathway protein E
MAMPATAIDIAMLLTHFEADSNLLPYKLCWQHRVIVGYYTSKGSEATDAAPSQQFILTSDALTISQRLQQNNWLDHQFPQAQHVLIPESRLLELLHSAEKHHQDPLKHHAPLINDGLSADRAQQTSISLQGIAQTENPVVKLVDRILFDALAIGASDIHWETRRDGLTIKYRLDGVLIEVQRLSQQAEGINATEVVSRLKILAQLDIAETRIPQDGRFQRHIEQQPIDYRVSVMPSLLGEDVVLRILDKNHLTAGETLTLTQLGMASPIRQQLLDVSQAPFGMLLVTGPTGSGKTTTLYGLMNEIHNGQEKFVTIEDPVEYQLPGVLQIPVNERKGLTFSRGLRSILRHDPDLIMVGEIRDEDTLQIAVQAALTGHKVLTTLHANHALDVISRCLHMGVELYSFLSALNGILAQRLVRKVCSQCAMTVDSRRWIDQIKQNSPGLLTRQLQSTLDQLHLMAPNLMLNVGQGCESCRFTGYKGRHAIAELLCMTDELRQMLLERQAWQHVKAYAISQGMRPLREAALDAVIQGTTTIVEINRVTAMSLSPHQDQST